MNRDYELKIISEGHAKTFMTQEEYRTFAEEFQKQVKPILDKQREARLRSEESARNNYIPNIIELRV